MVAEAIRDEVRMAKTGDDLLRLESDRIIEAVVARSQGARAGDVSWAPERAQYTLSATLADDPQGVERLRAALEGRDPRAELPGLVDDPPAWLREASAGVWESIARLCDVSGLWAPAQRAYEEAADRPGADRARALMAASGSAGHAGDNDAQQRLRTRAENVGGDQTMPRLVAISEDPDPQSRLEALSEVAPTGNREVDGLVEAQRALAYLEQDRADAAENAASAGIAVAPWSLPVREAVLAVTLARNGARRRAGQSTERRALLEAAEAYRRLRDELRASLRYRESGGMVDRVAQCQNLADRPDLAGISLREALDEELTHGETVLSLAQTAMNSGDPDLAEELLDRYDGDHEGAELMRAHLDLRDAERRRVAITVLDRRVSEGDFEAGLVRLMAAVPSTDEVGWSDDAEAVVREREPTIASFIRSEWHERRGRAQEASRELSRHADDPRALKELMVRFGERGEWTRAAAPARAILGSEPNLQTRIMVAQALLRAGDAAQAEFVFRQVLDDPDLQADERHVAFDELVAELFRQRRFRDARELAEVVVRQGYADAGWAEAYALVREGRLTDARRRIEGLTPRGVGDATLAADVYFSLDPPTEALRRIVLLADALSEHDENIELRATLALLRAPEGEVSEADIERAGPVRFVERFPRSRALWKQTLSDEDAIALVRQHAIARAEVATAAEQHVLVAGNRLVGALAYAVGISLAQTWAQLPELPLAYQGGVAVEELDTVRRAAGSPAIVETGGLHSLQLLGNEVTAAVLAEFPLSVVAPAAIEDLIRATMPDLSEGQDVVRQLRWIPETKQMVSIELTPEEAAAPRKVAEAMQRLAGRLHPSPPLRLASDDDTESADRSPVIQAYVEVTELARVTGYPIYTDDRLFRQMLASAGIPCFGTLAVLSALRDAGAVSPAAFDTAMETLADRGVQGIPTESAEE